MNTEWRGRAAFAAVAEAIGINTDYVMAYSPAARVALWSDDEMVYCSLVLRDADGILFAGPRREVGTLDEFLREALGGA